MTFRSLFTSLWRSWFRKVKISKILDFLSENFHSFVSKSVFEDLVSIYTFFGTNTFEFSWLFEKSEFEWRICCSERTVETVEKHWFFTFAYLKKMKTFVFFKKVLKWLIYASERSPYAFKAKNLESPNKFTHLIINR